MTVRARRRSTRPRLAPLLFPFLLAGCAIHPRGESEERERAAASGKPFEKVFRERDLPPLAAQPSWSEVLRHAFVANGELEARYWEWRSALEAIPQEASPRTTGALFFNHLFSGGSATFWDRTSLGAGTDPMANLPWPGKLATRGRIALEKARAAGLRFEKAKFDLQSRALVAYHDWALLAESIRLQESNVSLLNTISLAAEGRARAGDASQGDLLKTRTQRDLAQNELLSLRARLPGSQAALNSLLGRPADVPLTPPGSLPAPRRLDLSDDRLLALIAERNPELSALARELEGKRDAIRLARQEYIPEFALSGTADLAGMGQSIAGMVTLPLLRHEALRAGVAQARADLRATEAMRRQTANDLRADAILKLYAFRNAERQAALFQDAILPRSEQVVATTRADYSAGRVPLVELLDSQRMLLEARTTLAQLRTEREKLLAEIEALAAVDAEAIPRNSG